METKLIPLAEGLYAIDQGMVRAYLIVGSEKALLLDSGAAPCDVLALVRSVTDKPVTFVLTHTDGDHTANAAAFPTQYLHAEEAAIYTPAEGCACAELQEGARFALGGRTLEVIHIPGHTPGSLALLDRTRKEIFSGDSVSLASVFMFGPTRSMERYLSSLRRLKAMAEAGEFTTVWPAHGPCPLDTAVIGELIDCAEGIRSGSIVGEKAENMPMPGAAPLLGKLGRVGILYR